MIPTLALPLRPRRLAALALLTLAACGGDASDAVGPGPTTPRLTEVRVSPAVAEVALDGSITLLASPRDANGRPMSGVSFTWRSLDPQVATVDASGTVSGSALGTARIVASASGHADTAQVTVRAAGNPGTGVATLGVDPGQISLRPGTTGTLTAVLRDAANAPVSATVSWTSDDESVVRVSASGTLTAVALGETRVVARVGALSASTTVLVEEAAPPAPTVARIVITPASPSVVVGEELTLAATPQNASGGTVAGRVVLWTSANAAVATVSAAGRVHGVAAGTTTITARVDNVTQTVTVTVTPQPASSTTLSFSALERGTVARDADGDFELPGLLLVGDDDEFGVVALQGFVTYSLAGIPANAQIQSAQLGVTMDAFGIFGDPFALGGLYVERTTALALNVGAVGSGSVLVSSALTPSSTTNITALVRAALQAGETAILLRYRFAQTGNANGATDQLEFSAGTLSVTYTP